MPGTEVRNSTKQSKQNAPASPADPSQQSFKSRAREFPAPTKGTLTLKRGVDQGVVRQSFSHGRTKAIVVEKVKRRTLDEAQRREEEILRLRREEEARQREEQARRLREEEERRLEQERKQREETERRQREEERRRQREEAERRQQEEENRKQQAREDRQGRDEQSRADRKERRNLAAKVRLPPIQVIPKQSKRAIAFTSVENGPLAVLPDKASIGFDPEQAQLYSRMRAQLRSVIEETPSQQIGQLVNPIEDFLSHPEKWEDVKYKKLLWSSGNVLRNVLAKHDAVAGDLDPDYSKLPSVLAESLRSPVETWNVIVLGDSTLRDLDRERLGLQEVKEAVSQISAAAPILVAAARDRHITTRQAGDAIAISLAAASESNSNIHARQAKKLARGTSRNVIVQILRGAQLQSSSRNTRLAYTRNSAN